MSALSAMNRWAFVLAVAAASASPSIASADGSEPSAADIATARDLFRDGARLAGEGKWQEALDAYTRSEALRPSTLTRYSIAVVQERIGKLVEAMESLHTFLRSDHDTATTRYVPAAQELLHSIEGRIGRIKVVVPGDPRGAEVRIDGERVHPAAVGVYRRVNPGIRRVELRVPGLPPSVRIVDIAPGGSIEVTLRPSVHDDDRQSTGSVSEPSADAERVSSSPRRKVGLAFAVGGAAVFVAGVGTGAYGYSRARSSTTRDGSVADTARAVALIGDIGMSVGLVAAGVGSYLVFTSRANKTSSVSTPVAGGSGIGSGRGGQEILLSPWVSDAGGGVFVNGRF